MGVKRELVRLCLPPPSPASLLATRLNDWQRHCPSAHCFAALPFILHHATPHTFTTTTPPQTTTHSHTKNRASGRATTSSTPCAARPAAPPRASRRAAARRSPTSAAARASRRASWRARSRAPQCTATTSASSEGVFLLRCLSVLLAMLCLCLLPWPTDWHPTAAPTHNALSHQHHSTHPPPTHTHCRGAPAGSRSRARTPPRPDWPTSSSATAASRTADCQPVRRMI